MKILVTCPDMEIVNPFINILINEISSENFEIDYGIDAFWKPAKEYDIIHVHWPEDLFFWKPIKEYDVDRFADALQIWKNKEAKLVYTRHDEGSHYPLNTAGSELLYKYIISNADAIVHMGRYSLDQIEKIENRRKNQVNTVIPHHIYDTIYADNIPKERAREVLNIPQDKTIILTFGYYRTEREYTMVKEAFEGLDVPNKYLLAPSWNNDRITVNGDCFLGKGVVDCNMLPFCFAAADAVLIQRVKIHNSGNMPMAFLFDKPVAGPNIGNLKEYLEETKNFTFDPCSIPSVINALTAAINSVKENHPPDNGRYAKENWSTAIICDRYENLYRRLISLPHRT